MVEPIARLCIAADCKTSAQEEQEWRQDNGQHQR